MSVSAAATRPPVQDSAVATISFFALHRSSRAVAAACVSRSAITETPSPGPGQADRRGRHRDDAFPASGEAELLAGRGLHGDAVHRDVGDLGNALADRVAVRADPRGLADDGQIDVRDLAAALGDALHRKLEELIRRRALPARIVRREM